jgi:vacuolar-type H+-ATPase subunit E/Vma4
MAIEDILQALDAQAQADCESVVAEAKEHGKMSLDDAQRSADAVHENFARQVERIARTEAAKIVNAARLEAKMEVSSAKGDGVSSVFEATRTKLPDLRSADYDRLFDALAGEALADVSGDVAIHVAAADVERAKAAAAARGVTAEVLGDIDTAGGLIVEMSGGRIIRRNTLEDRLDRVSQSGQADVARVLFS